MSIFPYSRLFIGPLQTVVISGPHIQIVDSTTGDVLSSTVDLDEKDKVALLGSGPVRCAVLDKSRKYLASAGDDKQLKLWETDGMRLLSERELPKKPTGIEFTGDSQTILVSDKFGDIFSYPLHPVASTARQTRDALSSHENPSGGQLILGHASLLTSFLLSFDEKYIVTADRDEHIRVSWYPQGYNIEMYCLGHEKFISAIHIPKFSPSSLISGGGDPMLKVWDWMSGTVKHEIDISTVVEPFVAVRSVKRKRDGEEVPEGTRGRRKKRKASGKGKLKDAEGVNELEAIAGGGNDVSPEGVGADEVGPPDELENTTRESKEQGEPILVLHKIDSLDSEQGRHIIFSAVGTTALFACPYSEEHETSDINAFDFGKPVLDFVIVDNNFIWVSLDSEWNKKEHPSAEHDKKLVRVVKLTAGKLTELDYAPPLLSTLNSKCPLPASTAELKALDLYLALSAMPKNAEVEHDAMDRDILNPDEDGTVHGKPVSKKVLGRLKNKKALLAKAQAGGGETVPGDEDVPDLKRAKSEPGGIDEDLEDVAMVDS